MTNLFFHVIVDIRIKRTIGPERNLCDTAHEIKAMMQIHTYSFINTKRLYDLQGTSMPSADKAEWLVSTCLNHTGSSGKSHTHRARDRYLRPDAFMCILE